MITDDPQAKILSKYRFNLEVILFEYNKQKANPTLKTINEETMKAIHNALMTGKIMNLEHEVLLKSKPIVPQKYIEYGIGKEIETFLAKMEVMGKTETAKKMLDAPPDKFAKAIDRYKYLHLLTLPGPAYLTSFQTDYSVLKDLDHAEKYLFKVIEKSNQLPEPQTTIQHQSITSKTTKPPLNNTNKPSPKSQSKPIP
ncbi:MAG: hypothetical protein LBQ86_06255 [Holophagales bacterium]|jgi:hypothetical protein|nr:hypothetical protein [Holophagales bacterium]